MRRIGDKLYAETPKEQLRLERKRFKAKQERDNKNAELKRLKLLELDDGKNKKIINH